MAQIINFSRMISTFYNISKFTNALGHLFAVSLCLFVPSGAADKQPLPSMDLRSRPKICSGETDALVRAIDAISVKHRCDRPLIVKRH